jgi:hypothetical protein
MAFIAGISIVLLGKFISYLATSQPCPDWKAGIVVAAIQIAVLMIFLVQWFFSRTLPRFLHDRKELKEKKARKHREKILRKFRRESLPETVR